MEYYTGKKRYAGLAGDRD